MGIGYEVFVNLTHDNAIITLTADILKKANSHIIDVSKSWHNLKLRAGIENFTWHDQHHDFAQIKGNLLVVWIPTNGIVYYLAILYAIISKLFLNTNASTKNEKCNM